MQHTFFLLFLKFIHFFLLFFDLVSWRDTLSHPTILQITKSLSHLRSLNVVTVEVALEVEVSELFTFRGIEQLLEGSIRLDVMLILEVLFLDVVVDSLGDLRAAHLSASGLTEEAAEFIRDGSRALKDGRGTLDFIAILVNFRAAFTLASIFDLTVNALFEFLDLGDHGRGSFTEGVEVTEQSLEVFIKSGSRSSGYSGGISDRG
jgi:hypothetical protein